MPVVPTARPRPPARRGGSPIARRLDRRAIRGRAARTATAAPAIRDYRETSADLATSLSIDRARAQLPAQAGPYNGQWIATRILEQIAALSPIYAHALLERMSELTQLAALPEPAPPAQQPRASGRKRRGRR